MYTLKCIITFTIMTFCITISKLRHSAYWHFCYAECQKLALYDEYCYAECRYARCRYAECPCAECCGAILGLFILRLYDHEILGKNVEMTPICFK